MKTYEIWLGNYHLGQGYDPPTKPELVATVQATSFKIACVLYEHTLAINSLKMRMERGDTYIEDANLGKWHYEVETNSNAWTGCYYESEADAQVSFKSHQL